VFLGIYLLSIVITHILIFYILRIVRFLLKLAGEESYPDLLSPALVGICESVIYPAALLIGAKELIGVWLAVKVAGNWVRWRGEAASPETKPDYERLNEGRRRFNAFLIGNALSIMAAVATWIAWKIWALN
jgi:hypothetical protein